MDCKNKRNKKNKIKRKKDGCVACCWDKWVVKGEGRGRAWGRATGGDMEGS